MRSDDTGNDPEEVLAMKTFNEYLQFSPKRQIRLTHYEIKLLFKCRDKLEHSPYGKGMVDHSGKIHDPFIWVRLPVDLGGGLKIYIINGDVAIRFQSSPSAVSVGKAHKVHSKSSLVAPEKDPTKATDIELGSEDPRYNPDYAAANNLLAEIGHMVSELRKYKESLKKKIVEANEELKKVKFQYKTN